jgi:hypothetical protein
MAWGEKSPNAVRAVDSRFNHDYLKFQDPMTHAARVHQPDGVDGGIAISASLRSGRVCVLRAVL